MKKQLLFILLILSQYSFSQLAMGKWRTHFAYNAIEQIAQSDNKIFAVSEGSLFSIEKNTECIENEEGCKEYYGKMSGLNDGIISRIGFDNQNKKLLIIYKNGNIDIMSNGGTYNIPDLYNKKLSVSKEVNDISFFGDRAYLSCNFGIVVLNTKKNEISDSYFIGPNGSEIKILSTSIVENKLYALTENLIYTANVNEPNLVNFEYWSTLPILPGNGELKKIDVFAEKLILQRGDKLYSYTTTDGWHNILPELSASNYSISNKKMIIYSSTTALYIADETLSTKLIENVGEVLAAEYDTENQLYWLAGNAKGVIATTENPLIEPKIFKPLGPAVNSPWSMTFAGEKLFVVPGGRWAAQYEKRGEVMIFENEKWTNLNTDSIRKEINNNVNDFMNIAVDPTDKNHFFVTSYGTGLYEFKDNKFIKWHNHLNSTLETVVPANATNYIRLDGAIFDKNGNLFLANIGVVAGIKLLTKNGEWKQLRYPESSNSAFNTILISKQNPNHKWVNSIRYTPGIFVFDDNGTPENNDDDPNSTFLSTFIDTDNEGAKISPSNIYCLVEDQNGVIWAGTEQGPLLFYNTSKVFDVGYTCSRVKIPRNDGTGLADYLLQSDRVKSIAIDGANRKWIGTESSGVYLMSENGQETIKQFNTTNSPLLSNDIISIAINPLSGEVFFGTSKGLVSYQGDAVNANEEFKDVHVYPNPVREDYNGIITITGLIKDTQVKITDLNGNLVCQTISNGGIATWDGKNTNGNKVNTGIYLVICAYEDGTQNAVTKIMVIN